MGKVVNVFTDGSSTPIKGANPPEFYGGLGVIVQSLEMGYYWENSDYNTDTTNNQMEIDSVRIGLEKVISMIEDEKIQISEINVISDSAYVVNCFNDRWYTNWRLNNWKSSAKKPVANREYWERVLEAYEYLVYDLNITPKFMRINSHINKTKEAEQKAYVKFCNTNGLIKREVFDYYKLGNERVDELAGLAGEEAKKERGI